ncbi:MAG: glycoside hydrolase family 20 zincin-like fold domain-containing protein [Acidobacteriaceae bacterium]
MKVLLLAATIGCLSCGGLAQTVSPLFARGYTVIPEPQKVSLDAHDFTFGPSWQLEVGKSVAAGDVAVETLREDLNTRFDVRLGASGSSSDILSLRIEPGNVPIGEALDSNKASLKEQAYRISLHEGAVMITANAPTGLLYGVDTFIQLLRRDMGKLWLPEGTIEDWPDLQLRQIYWDNDHQLERMDDLKRDLRQAAFYKINGFVIKFHGHFQYKSAPAVVEPYAISPPELQELTDYGLHYHIQLIPYVDGPAHSAYVLKHPEYAKLREFPDNNYEFCATNPESYKMLEGMSQDLMEANKGVKYFYLSTDEPYYFGLAHNSQCNEADLKKKLGSPGQVFAYFVDKAGGYLHDHGRTVVFWGEYPLKPSDIPSLPPYLINGEVYGPEFDKAYHQRGIRQMIYTSNEGEENLFPDYIMLPQSERLHSMLNDEYQDQQTVPRLDDIFNTISFNSARVNTSIIGEVNAGWTPSGVNAETMWLAYIASGSWGWHPGSPSPSEVASSFYSLFYGPKVVDMDRIYQLMSEQAQSWIDSWDLTPSRSRKPLLGNSHGIYKTPRPAHDQSIPLPPAPGSDLEYRSTWSGENARRIALALQAKHANDILLGLLHENMQRAQFNRYNLEVFTMIANLCRQNLMMIAGIHEMDIDLATASQLKSKDPKAAIEEVDDALDIAGSIRRQRNDVLKDATTTWYKAWFPRVSDANGRHFLHEQDDSKDYLTDRTVGMGYLVYREKILPFGQWVNAIAAARNQFAAAHNLPARNYHFDWQDFSELPGVCTGKTGESWSAPCRY